MDSFRLTVPGMNSCRRVRVVTAALRDIEGVRTVEADGTTVTVAGTIDPGDIVRALAACGYTAV